ncbi:2-hydroxyacid dehydrogenase [Mongoliitalea daihaiensis]|uniref:2-hydroxyacid dehydrogenase n=1 Tax=Mongoliitalea daihaiensis TaxID=2782006 RepID=UPI001F1F34F2|nr:glyoxylate/hydroxypyruvate reductase A [Mongoliitalea daihaiensis]UJP64289.1 glyoxylate/hydroxypyruvate reductase A [Mongoliitalea daihaiensis]
MGLAIISPGKNMDAWISNFQSLDPSIPIQVYPDIQDPLSVEAALLWNHPPGILLEFPNLKLICSMGAGVDHILKDPQLPEHTPITRIVDEKLTWSMTNYVVMGVLNHHRQLVRYQQQQREKRWDMSSPEIEVSIGVLGVGALGNDIVDKLSYMGFKVSGFGKSPKIMSYPYYFGSQLDDFLQQINVLVCMLPLTAETEGYLNLELFKKCNPGTYLINVARGKHLNEQELLVALERGYISGALLDVFHVEPLPSNHPFWEEERIMMTPHIASVTNPNAAAPQILENFRRMKMSQPLINQINRIKGY